MRKKAKTHTYNQPNQLLAQLLPYNYFYKWKTENIYTPALTSYWHSSHRVIIFINGKDKTNIYNRFD